MTAPGIKPDACPAAGTGLGVGSAAAPALSVIIPAFNSEQTIGACLKAVLEHVPAGTEVIVVDDASTDRTAAIAEEFPCTLIRLQENAGPARARNMAARQARAPRLFFLDADIVVHRDTLAMVLATFDDNPELAAFFGSYGPDTPDPGLFSQYKNLLHHYTHQTSREDAATFCSGFGAVRKEVFLALDGYDGRQRVLEDIEFGYRLHRNGYRVRLVKQLQMTHLKRYTLRSLVQSDLWNRAAAWTELMLRYRMFRSDLNTKPHHVLSVTLSVALLPAAAAASFWPAALYGTLGMSAAFLWLNRGFLQFVGRNRSLPVTAGVCGITWMMYVLSTVGVLVGVAQWSRSALRKSRALDQS